MGIRRTGSGWQAYLHLHRQFYSKHFPPDTDPREMRRWIDLQRARVLLRLPAPVTGETFGDDCQRYLDAVRTMPTYADRRYRILQWRDALGPHIRRTEITSVLIRQQLAIWAARLSPASLNLRRTALMHLYTVLDGASAPNPVKDVPRFREQPRTPALPDLATAQRVIARTRGKTRARLEVLLWTGWPAAQLKQLTAADVNWRAGTARVRGRQKGRGTRDRVLPLLPQALTALRRLRRDDGWGPFSNSSVHTSLTRACDALGVPRFRPYDLRHLFLTTVALVAKDDRVVAELALHADIRQTRRYTEQSVNPRLTTALAAVARFARIAAPRRGTGGHRRPARKRRSSRKS